MKNRAMLSRTRLFFLYLFFIVCTIVPSPLAALPGIPTPSPQASSPAPPPSSVPAPESVPATGTVQVSPSPPSTAPATGTLPSLPPATPVLPHGTPSPAVSNGIPQNEAPVMLNNRVLITVRDDSGHSAAERAGIVQQRLEEALSRAQAAPSVDIVTVQETPVIQSGGLYLISVTNSDAASLGVSVSDLAAMWRDDLEKGIRRAWHERSEGYTREALIKSLCVILLGIVLTVIALFIFHRVFKYPGHLIALIIWLTVISLVLWLFPESRSLSSNLTNYVLIPIALFLVTVIIVALMLKPTDSFVTHFFDIFQKIREKDLDQSGRSQHRIGMLSVVAKVLAKITIVVVAVFLYLNSLHVNVAATLAGAGIIGVGLGIAAQDLLKDYLAGIFFVFEDQFAVGDVIRTAGFSGTVEDFTLRITRLRDMEGRLISIPNSTIRSVENLSSKWSQVDCSVYVAYDTDLARAMALIIEVADELRSQWQDIIIADPEMLGVDALEEVGVKLRMVMKTTPFNQWKVKRELLLRIKSRFEKEGIEIPCLLNSLCLRSDKGKGSR
ncbi:MAG: mechanosensitive ion channel domain-containing protein [Vulcanimicrobiota bacterium]